MQWGVGPVMPEHFLAVRVFLALENHVEASPLNTKIKATDPGERMMPDASVMPPDRPCGASRPAGAWATR